MTTETESIDRLFLELSQFTRATTAKEDALAQRVAKLEYSMRSLIVGIEHLSAIARLWEPDYATGQDRRGWLMANDAKDDAKKLLWTP